MKAKLIGRYIDQNTSLSIQDYSSNYFLNVWHYHPELELDIIKTSTGTKFIGDSVEKFEPGDIVLIGKNLPHLWQNDKAYFEEKSTLKADAVVIHFDQNFGSGLLNMPEMAEINHLLKKAALGVAFTGSSNEIIFKKVDKLVASSGYEKIVLFVDILGRLAKHSDYRVLSSPGFVDSFQDNNSERMEPVYNYVMNHFKTEIKLETVANLAHMNPSSFSRYFSQLHKKTFTQFLNEIRIGYASKLLIENNCNISTVCYESGFRNISNFNRLFKEVKKITPSEYIRLHKNCK